MGEKVYSGWRLPLDGGGWAAGLNIIVFGQEAIWKSAIFYFTLYLKVLLNTKCDVAISW
jgi:hypothetical protein